MPANERVYAEPEIRARLAQELPHWETRNQALVRRIGTSGWRATLMIVNAIGHLAEVAWHHPELDVAYDRVTVRLSTHTAHGVTDKDFALAKKIEAVVFWNPAQEDGALEGLPLEPRYAYLQDGA